MSRYCGVFVICAFYMVVNVKYRFMTKDNGHITRAVTQHFS